MNEQVDRSTLDEMVRYTKRIATLKERLGDAEGQLLQRWGHAYRAGLLTDEQVVDAAMQVASGGHLPDGWVARWNDAFGFDVRGSVYQRLYRLKNADRERQNGDPGWYGTCDTSGISFPRPPKGQPVVYVLYDINLDPIYVGSTGTFADRLKAHRRDGKPVAHWRAMPYTTREEAYLAEDAMLRAAKPEMNRKASR
jgi:hypothetical protein